MRMDVSLLKFEGCNFFRQRLVLATLSSRPIKITSIREDAEEPGLKGKRAVVQIDIYRAFYLRLDLIKSLNVYLLVEFEAGFIRLLDKLTNGSRIEVDITGTN